MSASRSANTSSSICWCRTPALRDLSLALWPPALPSFIAGSGTDGFRANVRSAIKRIRNKFRACDPTFDEIENYTGFGYAGASQIE
jgi:hypothetical protein